MAMKLLYVCSDPGTAGLGMSLKKQRRLIMSGKSIHHQESVCQPSRQDDGRRTDHERDITMPDFEKMRKEVDTLGACLPTCDFSLCL